VGLYGLFAVHDGTAAARCVRPTASSKGEHIVGLCEVLFHVYAMSSCFACFTPHRMPIILTDVRAVCLSVRGNINTAALVTIAQSQSFREL